MIDIATEKAPVDILNNISEGELTLTAGMTLKDVLYQLGATGILTESQLLHLGAEVLEGVVAPLAVFVKGATPSYTEYRMRNLNQAINGLLVLIIKAEADEVHLDWEGGSDQIDPIDGLEIYRDGYKIDPLSWLPAAEAEALQSAMTYPFAGSGAGDGTIWRRTLKFQLDQDTWEQSGFSYKRDTEEYNDE